MQTTGNYPEESTQKKCDLFEFSVLEADFVYFYIVATVLPEGASSLRSVTVTRMQN